MSHSVTRRFVRVALVAGASALPLIAAAATAASAAELPATGSGAATVPTTAKAPAVPAALQAIAPATVGNNDRGLASGLSAPGSALSNSNLATSQLTQALPAQGVPTSELTSALPAQGLPTLP